MANARTANINVRVEPEAKEGAERVFAALGISMSDAINMFCKQVQYKQRIPFELEIPAGPARLDISNMTKQELIQDLRRVDDEAEAGEEQSMEEAFAEIMERTGYNGKKV